jgi:uncharacterized lipoprotein YddW (UPF0748 family)
MSNRRNFLKNTMIASAAAPALLASTAAAAANNKSKKIKNWIWINPNGKDSVEDLKARYKLYKNAGISGLLFEAISEKHFVEAKLAGLEAHCWNWTMNKGNKSLLQAHPDWYAVSRDGKSCAEFPPYVGYYRWLCPSKAPVQQYLNEEADQILSKDFIDGLHLDYIRYCDVILPKNLWSQYKIEQRMELPQYDFCYCNTCREKYQAKTGKDPLTMEYPDASLSWRLYRYEAINNIVNQIAVVAKQHNKKLTAAVFPTPEVARRIVRQDWTNWNLDGVFPMTYNKFYQEDIQWIGDAVKEGIHFLHGKFPLYAGLYLPDFNNDPQQIKAAIKVSLDNSAAGVSFFGDVNTVVLNALTEVMQTI